jgi:hypothetical protein
LLIIVTVLALASAAGCNGAAMNAVNSVVPKPNASAVAGVAAAAAGVITLADPDAAAKRQEQKEATKEQRPIAVKAVVPADVFDRLDAAQVPDASGAAPPSMPPRPTPAPQPTEKPALTPPLSPVVLRPLLLR